jgi:hypothetical protein
MRGRGFTLCARTLFRMHMCVTVLVCVCCHLRRLGRFMPPGSAAIELMPFHFEHMLYTGMAHLAGVGMYRAYSQNGTHTYAHDTVRCDPRGGG